MRPFCCRGFLVRPDPGVGWRCAGAASSRGGPEKSPWRGSPGANRRCAGWFCLFRTQRLDDERRLVPLRAPARRLSALPARRGIAWALPDALRVLGRMGLPFLLSSLAGTRGGLAGLRPGRPGAPGAGQRLAFGGELLGRMRLGGAALGGTFGFQGGQCGGLDVARQLAEQDQRLAQVVYRGAGQLVADFRQHGLARLAIVTAGADLDQAMGSQRPVDFLEHGLGQAVVADQDDGAQG